MKYLFLPFTFATMTTPGVFSVSFAKETEKTPGVVVVARVDGKNRYFKPRKSFS